MGDNEHRGLSAGLTATQRALLGLDDTDLSDEAIATVDREIEHGRASAEAAVIADALTLKEAARRTRRTRDDLVADRGVYAVATRHGTVIPSWQMSGRAIAPGMGEVLSALPTHLHPLEVGEFMTRPSPELGGEAPVVWLARGRSIATVVALADALAWE